MELSPTPQRPASRRRSRLPRALALSLLAAIAALLLAPVALGMTQTIVRDPAMGAWAWDGSLAVTESVPSSDLEVGDVVTFAAPAPYAEQGTVTRRVVAVVGWTATTRADGAPHDAVDPWRLDLGEGSYSRVEAHVPLLGRLLGRPPVGLVAALSGLAALTLTRRRRVVPLVRAGEIRVSESVGARRGV